jgi:hypothetical protein
VLEEWPWSPTRSDISARVRWLRAMASVAFSVTDA